MPRPITLSVATLITLALFCPAVLAEDSVKIDPRVKGIEKQLERESKPVNLDAKRAKDAFVAAYQKECKARVKILESAMAACEKKIKMAKSASDAKSEEALTAKLEELKVELEAWKGNEGKKWMVRLEEKSEEEKTKNTEVNQPNLTMRFLAGKWKLKCPDGREFVLSFSEKGHMSFHEWSNPTAIKIEGQKFFFDDRHMLRAQNKDTMVIQYKDKETGETLTRIKE